MSLVARGEAASDKGGVARPPACRKIPPGVLGDGEGAAGCERDAFASTDGSGADATAGGGV